MSGEEVHVVPSTTTMDRQHDLTDDCWCGTTTEPVKREDGSVGWVVVHRRALTFVPIWEFMRTPDGTVQYTHLAGEGLERFLDERREKGDGDDNPTPSR